MNIVHLINVRWFNATAWYAFRLIESSILAGDKAAVAGLSDSPVINKAKELGVHTIEAPFTSNNFFEFFKNLKKIHKLIKDINADALVCHRGEMFWIIALDKFIFRRKYKLIRVRGDVRPPKTDIFSKFTHNIACSHIITSAEFIRKFFIEKVKTRAAHVDTIYGGVNRSVFYKDEEKGRKVRSQYNFKDDDYVVSVVGRFDPVKGHNIFLKACSKAYKDGLKELKIILAGFPENIKLDEMQQMIDDNGLKDITIITGKVDDITGIMNAADLGVISSLGSEAICRVAMEFMACGTPVISSNAGVLPEMLPSEFRYDLYDDERLACLIKEKKGFIKIYDQKDFYNEFIEKIKSYS